MVCPGAQGRAACSNARESCWRRVLRLLVLCLAGKGRMFKCLQESLAQPDFGQACRAQVEERGQRMQEDYRLDYGVAEACEPDVTTFCAAEKARIQIFLHDKGCICKTAGFTSNM
jgi:hypothetical protein